MLIKNQKKLLRVSALVIIIAIIVSLFSACVPDRVPEKDTISSRIDSVITQSNKEYQYVHLYLHDLGITNYNVSKFIWAETRFQTYYNFEGGMPTVKEHAKLTAEAFVNDYYDKTDITNKDAVTNALLTCYVDVIGDKYSLYRTPVEHQDYDTDMSGKFGGIGIVVEYNHTDETLLVTNVYIDSPAETAGIKVGDYLIAVDGKSKEEVGYMNLANLVRGEIGSTVTLTLLRGEETIIAKATRAEIEEKTVAYEITESNYGYIQITGFKGNTYEQFVEAVDAVEKAGVVGVIFDLRGNLGGYVDAVCNMISYIIPTGHTMVSYQYKGTPLSEIKSTDDIHPTKTNPQNTKEPLVEDHVLNLPMVVLCNEYTASAGELFTAAIRDYTDMGITNGKIVGTKTFGKGIMQSSWTYPSDGASITMTVAYYNPPCGENYHGDGITPDRVVENEIVENATVDKQLSAAYEELTKLLPSN